MALGQQTCATFEEHVRSHEAEREADDRGLVQGPCEGRLQRQKAAQVGKQVRLQPAPLPGGLAAQLPAEGRLDHILIKSDGEAAASRVEQVLGRFQESTLSKNQSSCFGSMTRRPFDFS